MFCKKCGRPTEGEKILCDECAAAETAEQTTMEEKPAFALNTQVAPVKKKSPIGLIIAAAVAVIAIVAAILFWPSADKPHQEPTPIELAGQAYGTFLQSLKAPAPTATDYKVTVNAGTDLMLLLESLLISENVDLDINWLKSISVNLHGGAEGDVAGADLGIGINGTDVASLSVILDMAKKMAYVGIPELSGTYLSASADLDGMPDPSMLGAMEETKKLQAALAAELPDQTAFEAMLTAYETLIKEKLPEGEQSMKTVTLGELTREYEAITRKLTEKDATALVVAVLEKAKDDKTLQQMVTAFCNYINGYGKLQGEEFSPVDPKEIFDQIPELIADLQSTEPGDSAITLVTMKDANRFSGLTLTDSDGTMVAELLLAFDTNKEIVELKLPEDVKILGESTVNEGKQVNSWKVFVKEADMLTVYLEDIAVNGRAGKIRLVPGAALLQELAKEAPALAMVGSVNPELRLTWKDTNVNVELWTGDSMFVGIDVSATAGEAYKPAKPEKTASAQDQMALLTWLSEADFSGVLQSLKNAGVPQEYVDMLQNLANQFSGAAAA